MANYQKRDMGQVVDDIQVKALKTLIENADSQDWREMWATRDIMQQNGHSHKPYRGANQIVLTANAFDRESKDPRWLTFKQAQEEGLSIRKGAKSEIISFYTSLYQVDKKDKNGNLVFDANGKVEKEIVKGKPTLRYFNVFNGEDVVGIKPFQTPNHSPEELTEQRKVAFARAEALINDWSKDKNLTIREFPNKDAFFQFDKEFSKGAILLPVRTQFDNLEAFYTTAFHELAHSTVLNGIRTKDELSPENTKLTFGSKAYAREELVAELSALYIAQELGINTNKSDLNKASFAYIKDYYEGGQLTDKDLSIALKDAQRAANTLLQYVPELTLENVLSAEAEKVKQADLTAKAEEKLSQELAQPEQTAKISKLAENYALLEKELSSNGWSPNAQGEISFVTKENGEDYAYKIEREINSPNAMSIFVTRNGERIDTPKDNIHATITAYQDSNLVQLMAENIVNHIGKDLAELNASNPKYVEERVETLRDNLENDRLSVSGLAAMSSNSPLSEEAYKDLSSQELLAKAKTAMQSLQEKPLESYSAEEAKTMLFEGNTPNKEIDSVLREIAIRNNEHINVVHKIEDQRNENEVKDRKLLEIALTRAELELSQAKTNAQEMKVELQEPKEPEPTMTINEIVAARINDAKSDPNHGPIYTDEVFRNVAAELSEKQDVNVSISTSYHTVGYEVTALTDKTGILYNLENAAIPLDEKQTAAFRQSYEAQSKDHFETNRKFSDIKSLDDFSPHIQKELKASGAYQIIDEATKQIPSEWLLLKQQESKNDKVEKAINDMLKSVAKGTFELTTEPSSTLEMSNETLLAEAGLAARRLERELRSDHSQDYNALRAEESKGVPVMGGESAVEKAYSLLREVAERADVKPEIIEGIEKRQKQAFDDFMKRREEVEDIRDTVLHYIEDEDNEFNGKAKTAYYEMIKSDKFVERDVPAIVQAYISDIQDKVMPNIDNEHTKKLFEVEFNYQTKAETKRALDQASQLYYAEHYNDYTFNVKSPDFQKLASAPYFENDKINVEAVKTLVPDQLKDAIYSSELDVETRKQNAAKSIIVVPSDKDDKVTFANIQPEGYNVVSLDYSKKDKEGNVIETTHRNVAILSVNLDEETPEKSKMSVYDIDKGEQRSFFLSNVSNMTHIGGEYTTPMKWLENMSSQPIIVPQGAAEHLLRDASLKFKEGAELSNKSMAEIVFDDILKRGTVNITDKGEQIVNDSIMNNTVGQYGVGPSRLLSNHINDKLAEMAIYGAVEKNKYDRTNYVTEQVYRYQDDGSTALVHNTDRVLSYAVDGKKLFPQADTALVFADNTVLLQKGDNYTLVNGSDVKDVEFTFKHSGKNDVVTEHIVAKDLFDLAQKSKQQEWVNMNDRSEVVPQKESFAQPYLVSVLNGPELKRVVEDLKEMKLPEMEVTRANLSDYHSPEAIEKANSHNIAQAELVRLGFPDRHPTEKEAKEYVKEHEDQLFARYNNTGVIAANWVMRDEANPPLLFQDGSILKNGGVVEYNKTAYAEEMKAIEEAKVHSSPSSFAGLVNLNAMEVKYALMRGEEELAESYKAARADAVAAQREINPDYDKYMAREEARLMENALLKEHNELRKEIIKQPESIAEIFIKETKGLMRNADGDLQLDPKTLQHVNELYAEDEIVKLPLAGYDHELLERYNAQPKREPVYFVNISDDFGHLDEVELEEVKDALNGAEYLYLFRDDSMIATDENHTKYAIITPDQVDVSTSEKSYTSQNGEKQTYSVVNLTNFDAELLTNLKFTEVSLDNAKSLGLEDAEIKAYVAKHTEPEVTAEATAEVKQEQPKEDVKEDVEEMKLPTQAYVLMGFDKEDGTARAFTLSYTQEQGKDFLKVLQTVDIDELSKEVDNLHFREIAIPVERVLFPQKMLAPSEDTLLKLVEQDVKYRQEIKDIISPEAISEAEIVAASIENGKKPTVEEALAMIVGSPDKDRTHTREPHFNLDDHGNEKKDIMIFADGSKLDMRGAGFVPDNNIDGRVEVTNKLYVKEFASNVNSDYSYWKEFVKNIYEENKEMLQKHEQTQTMKMR